MEFKEVLGKENYNIEEIKEEAEKEVSLKSND